MLKSTAANESPLITQVPFGKDPLTVTANQILDHFSGQLPDLSKCQILLCEGRAAAHMRAALADAAEQRGFSALLGPDIAQLDQWVSRFAPRSHRILSRAAQELVLAEVLRGAVEIYTDTDPWLLTDQLITLFDELTRCSVRVGDTLNEFLGTLGENYGISTPTPSLEQEAAILHTLWRAWRQQLQIDAAVDHASAYQQQLQASLTQIEDQMLWIVGITAVTPAEAHWLQALMTDNRARIVLHGDVAGRGYHPDAPLSDLLQKLNMPIPDKSLDADDMTGLFHSIFIPSPDDLRQRALEFAADHSADPLANRLRTLAARDPEQEAQAVALQVRRWLLDDVSPVAIISEDRRLARRVRALLEASDIVLDDPGGWALSTTSAAALLERWLETVEEDFACGSLLDVLKSPFVNFSDRETHLALVRRLEQDIILHENIARGLERYRRHLDFRSERLPGWSGPVQQDLHQMLNKLEHASNPLLAILNGAHHPGKHLNAVQTSLKALGSLERFESDAAGRHLLQVLQRLREAADCSQIKLSWTEFRDWLGRNLERATFRSPATASPVQLLTPRQTRLQQFPAIIVAGCNRTNLPGSPATETFFNQRVRGALGLPTWHETMTEKLHHFCRILHSSERVLLTWHREKDGEAVPVSPWLELLDTFYRSAYGRDLHDHDLAALVARPDARPLTPDLAALPQPQTYPRPTLPVTLRPEVWTAYAHQRLVDCPYRFFAADALGLKAQDEIRETLSKSDYGSLVHRVVQAFNSKVQGLPDPWVGPLDTSHLDAATQLLDAISKRVFADALKENFQARSWFRQWEKLIPEYLDWEIERRHTWTAREVEVKVEKSLNSQLRIRGRIDRIDATGDSVCVLDMKTGHTPKPEEVRKGEAVQLCTYALMLDKPVSRLEYLGFSRDTVKTVSCADETLLSELLPAVQRRLIEVDELLQAGTALPAWGDPPTCNWCEFDGLCRRDMWPDVETPHD
ncbi:MAG: PD-(D/E)XK nuclease family protein [Thiogranum sp.]|nr:PD-(D/E)XK nuclease family protein [Thiogranum sp.]